MRDRGLSFLGVQPGEQRVATLMVGHSFFMGCGTVFFETAASATFLARFTPSYIPWVYIAAAGVNTVTGAIYARAQSRVPFARLMLGTLWFLLAVVVAVRLGFAFSGAAWVAFAGLVSYRIISSLTDLEYWAVASRIYDVRQAKRLFGLIGTGEVVARIAGAFCVPLLVRLGGVSNLMLLSAGAIALCLILASRVLHAVPAAQSLRAPPSGDPLAEARASSAAAGLREIVSNPYLFVVVAVAVLATFGKYFVDFAFLEQVSTLSRGESEIATVLGLFSGLTQTLSLLTRLLVSRPLLARWGIRVGVLVLPLAHAACALVIVALGIFGWSGAVLWAVIVNQGIYKTLKHPIDNASFKVLYQPLPARQRLAVQIAVEIIFSPAVVGVAGAVMLLFSSVVPYNPVRFAGLLFVVFVAWAVAARAAGRGYLNKLADILRGRMEGDNAFILDDATTLSVLRDRLTSHDPAAVCVALSLLEKASAADTVEVLLAQTSHAEPSVRRYAIERLLELSPLSLRRVRQRVSSDPEPSVRGVAMRAVAASAGDSAVDELTPYLDDADAFVRRTALTVLFSLPGPHANTAARAALAACAVSPRASDRAVAARLAGESGEREHVAALLQDPDHGVRREAILAAGELADPELEAALVGYLVEPRFAQVAARALAARGDARLPMLEALFVDGASLLLLRRLVYVLLVIGSPGAARALAAHLDFPDVTVRSRVLFALDRLGWKPPATARERIREALEREVRDAAWLLDAPREPSADPELGLVRAALADELALARQRMIHCLTLLHDRVKVQRVALHLAHPSKDKRAFAHELLDLLLDPRERALLVPFLSDAARPKGASKSLDDEVQAILRGPPRAMREWTRTVALYVLEKARQRRSGAAPKETAMLLIEKIIVLKTVPMFAQTREEVVAEIASIVEIKDCAEGDVIFTKGDVGDSMYIVVTGNVRVFDGETTLSLLGEREIFGELALLDPELRSASVATTCETRLFRLDGDLFSQLMAANVDIVRGVLHVLCERLRRTSASVGRV